MEKRLLLVFAHPDDESFTVGAVVARYVREQGCRVHLLLATRGEAGKPGSPPVCTPVMLAWQREREVREACRILGIERVTFLGFRDGHLADVPRHHLATPIRAYLDAFRPQVVVTFPPHGISGHPDHRAIQEATYAAITAPGTPEEVVRLYYVTLPASAAEASRRRVFTDPDDTLAATVSGEGYAHVAAAALAAHRSQHLSVESVFPGATRGDATHVRTKSHFLLAWARIPQPAAHVDDLFAGL
ncbi:MAG: PIG-L family deacetylase [Calditerricola sp.]|nr:PIG-L domain-containing protein [Bacillota bacterium]MCG0313647.1 PIG-L family deacetylase [Calditerricola sp.]